MLSSLVRVLIIAFALMAIAASALLLVVCISKAGAVFGACGVLLGSSTIAACLAWERRSKKLWLCAGSIFSLWVAATAWLMVHSPNGQSTTASPVRNRYVGDRWAFSRFAFGNLLPEGDQFALGFRLVPALDPLFTQKQATMLSGLTASIYQELETDANFHALGSVMPGAYDQLWGQPFNHEHYFLYVPPRLDRHQPHPALIFLHGSGGNFKAYTWLLSKVADELGMVLIAASYGMGDWHEPDTSTLIKTVLEDAAKIVSIDSSQLHLMGLSNGGLGVSQAGRTLGDRFQSLTFLSPVFESHSVSSAAFIAHWRGHAVLVVTGRQDDRVPFDYVSDHVESLKRAGVPVAFVPVDNADHFMLFGHTEMVMKTVTSWLRDRLATPSPAPQQSF